MAKTRVAATLNEQMLRIHKDFVAAGGVLPVTLDVLYEYAFANDKWQPQLSDQRKQFRKQMSQAMREDYFKDEKGRRVRRHHAVIISGEDANGKKITVSLWDVMDLAPQPHMEKAFAKRRRQIVGNCKQLKNDVDHDNESRGGDITFQLLLDFRDDVAEGDLSTEYNPDSTE